ncbi:MAG: transposase, partial [Bacteroidetes bacterium]|nr:transposase [Bacteroidota bacterium]
MKYKPEIHQRRSIRLKGYDYSQEGAYFVTICVDNQECLFGDIVDGKMFLNQAGEIVVDSWTWLTQQYNYVDLDEWIIMPNHLHGIITIMDGRCESNARTTSIGQRKSIGRIIGAFKTVSTKRINILHQNVCARLWQRN